MGKLICSGIMSLDGYIADEEGDFSWAAPDEEVHTFINELERPVGTYLYGRRMYEVMRYWDRRRVPDLPEPGLRRRRHPIPARRSECTPRAPRGAPVRQRVRLPAVQDS